MKKPIRGPSSNNKCVDGFDYSWVMENQHCPASDLCSVPVKLWSELRPTKENSGVMARYFTEEEAMADLQRALLLADPGNERNIMAKKSSQILYHYGPAHIMTFSERNKLRCESLTGFNHKLGSWSMSDWMVALTGEVGEAANIVKKLNRVRDGIPGNDKTPDELRAMLASELADVAIYLDLMIQAAGFDLEEIRDRKFNETSAKIGYKEP